MVQRICKDIKQLDYAKRHLQTTITSFKRLHMLVTAVEQLEKMADAEEYKEAANLLDAVSQLTLYFESYSSVPKISELRRTVDSVRSNLTHKIFVAFDEIGQLASNTADPSEFSRDDDTATSISTTGFKTLFDACLVVDALGSSARTHQVTSFCNSQLRPYLSIFKPASQFYGLDSIDRRFAWFRRLLKNIDDRFSNVFPPHWRVQYHVTLIFLDKTRDSVMKLLGDADDADSQNVIVMVKALQKTLLFEKEMMQRFAREYDIGKDHNNPTQTYDNEMEFDGEGNAVDSKSAKGIKLRYAREKAKKQAMNDKALKSNDMPRPPSVEEENTPLIPMAGMLSGCFDPFMGPYITLERQNLDEQLSTVIGDKAIDQRGGRPVFNSSINLFVYIKNSINRCTALTTGQTFFNLYKEYKKALVSYANLLNAKMPQSITSTSTTAAMMNLASGAPASSTPSRTYYKIPPGEEATVCQVIDTCEYCAETIETLEELVKDKMCEQYRETVDMMTEQDAFNDVTANGLKVLVSGLETNVEGHFRELSKVDWGSYENFNEESTYVRHMNAAITPFVTSISEVLPSSYFRNFCDKFATAFTGKYYGTLVGQKRFSETATQQLLLDVYNLKDLMLKLPTLGEEGGTAPQFYVKQVTKEFSKIEILLKLIGTPTDILVEVFRQQWAEGTFKDLQTVCSLKGMKKVEQTAMLESFGVNVSVIESNSGSSNPFSSGGLFR